jgi:hypothetical protein
VRRIDPLIVPRMRNPMSDQMQFSNPTATVTGSNAPTGPTAAPTAKPAGNGKDGK